jgi:uncharacterized surface protein with fasciclin (FAS1) repeats
MALRKIFIIVVLSSSVVSLCCENNSKHNTDSIANSYIYGVDTMTGSTRTVVSNLSRSKDFSTFVQLISDAGLKETLNKPGPFTVFSPTNQALENSTLEGLRDEKLLDLLTNHMIAGSIKISELNAPRKLKTLSGNEIEIVAENDLVKINGKKIYTVAINCSNGIIYPVNELLTTRQ